MSALKPAAPAAAERPRAVPSQREPSARRIIDEVMAEAKKWQLDTHGARFVSIPIPTRRPMPDIVSPCERAKNRSSPRLPRGATRDHRHEPHQATGPGGPEKTQPRPAESELTLPSPLTSNWYTMQFSVRGGCLAGRCAWLTRMMFQPTRVESRISVREAGSDGESLTCQH